MSAAPGELAPHSATPVLSVGGGGRGSGTAMNTPPSRCVPATFFSYVFFDLHYIHYTVLHVLPARTRLHTQKAPFGGPIGSVQSFAIVL